MKILYFTDTHDMGRNPGARIDDYHAAILEKFKEAYDVAINEQVDAVVHGGDWWHYPKVANTIYNQHQRLLRKLKRNKIPVYLVPGNHDLYGYSMDTIDQTSIGSLANAGLVKLLTRKKSYEIMDVNHTIGLHGREYSIDIDHDPINDYQITPNPAADFNFLFSHGMLLDKPFHPDVRYTLTKDVATDADYVFNGHYHPGWKMHTIGDTTFVNNGSTGRDEGSIDSVNRTPQYTMIEVKYDSVAKDSFVTVTAHEYKCAKAGKDVFDRTQLIQKKQHVRYLESFEQTVQDALAYEAFDPKDIIKKTKGLDKKLLKEALERIVEQEQKVQDSKLDGFIAKLKAIGLSYIELENFQSHKKTRVEFNAKGLNAITGASDSGKSAIIRALRWVLYNDPKGTDFIRFGTSRATVTVGFTDGSSITRSRTNSSAGEYIVRDEHGKETEFKGFGSNLPIDIANVHQMPRVELSAGVEKPLNFSFQLDGHFLLSESPAVRASTIGRLTGVHLVDHAVKEVAKEIRAITIDTNAGEKRIEELDESLKQYDSLDSEKKQLDAIRGLMQSAERAEKKIAQMKDMYDIYDTQTEFVQHFKNELKQYINVDKGLLTIQVVEEKMKELSRLTNLLDTSRRYKSEIAEIKADLMDYENIDKGLSLIEVSEKLQRDIDRLDHLYTKYCKLEAEENFISAELEEYEGISKIHSIDELDEGLETLKNLQNMYDHYSKMEEECAIAESQLQQATARREEVQLRVQELISQMGTCPTCHQSMDEHVAMEMLEHV